MSMRLISHVNRDDDLLEAWLRHYLQLGVGTFHLIVHGGWEQNRTLHAIKDRYPISIIDAYEGTFDVFEKRERLTWGLGRMGAGWVTLVDSDEFIELPYGSGPYGSIAATLRVMQWLRADAISAPMLQRFSDDGALDREYSVSPFEAYPWCSVDLYARLGQPQAVIDKYPLFLLGRTTALRSGGNHYPPNGPGSRIAPMLGVTHHFKWRQAVRDRLTRRADSTHPYRGESVQYLAYLTGTDWRLPIEGAFLYSRDELLRRQLLTRPRVLDLVRRRSDIANQGGGKRILSHMVLPDGLAQRIRVEGHRHVVLSGAGQGGRLFLEALRRQNITVSHIIDSDSTKWGTRVQGIEVCGLDEVLAAGERVFVAGSLSYGSQMEVQIRVRAEQRGLMVTVFTVDAPQEQVA